jgi:hypothetical protein
MDINNKRILNQEQLQYTKKEIIVMDPAFVNFKNKFHEILNDRYVNIQKVSLTEFYFTSDKDISKDEYPIAMITFRDDTLSKFICLTGRIMDKEKKGNRYHYYCKMPKESLTVKRYMNRIFNSKKNKEYYNKKLNKLVH